MKRIYLDHNATSPLRPVALRTLRECLGEHLGNPSSAHADGRRARSLLEDARERLAASLDCDRDEVVFTSGGTESNALALRAAASGAVVAATATEHPSVLEPARARNELVELAVDREGRLRLDEEPLAVGPTLVSVARANHETGVVQDLTAVVAFCRAIGAVSHTDASQAVGRLPLSFRQLDVDLMTVSAHKFGGPVGVGALIVRRGHEARPLLRGGGQEGGLRAGTEAAGLAAAFAAAAEDAVARLDDDARTWNTCVETLRERLLALDPQLTFQTPVEGRLPNTLNVSFPGRRGSSLVHRLDLEGVSVSHGAACSTGSLEPSPVLLAMGLDETCARAAVRISFGLGNTLSDVETFVSRLASVLDAVPARSTSRKTSRTENE